jgi:hypothetical protein
MQKQRHRERQKRLCGDQSAIATLQESEGRTTRDHTRDSRYLPFYSDVGVGALSPAMSRGEMTAGGWRSSSRNAVWDHEHNKATERLIPTPYVDMHRLYNMLLSTLNMILESAVAERISYLVEYNFLPKTHTTA